MVFRLGRHIHCHSLEQVVAVFVGQFLLGYEHVSEDVGIAVYVVETVVGIPLSVYSSQNSDEAHRGFGLAVGDEVLLDRLSVGVCDRRTENIVGLKQLPCHGFRDWLRPVEAEVSSVMLQSNDVVCAVLPHIVEAGKFAHITVEEVDVVPFVLLVYQELGAVAVKG